MNINLISNHLLRCSKHNTFSFSRIYKNTSLRSLSLCNCTVPSSTKKIILTSKTSLSIEWKRNEFYCTDDNKNRPTSSKIPQLMDFPKITWPSLIKSIRNFILATFIIKPYFDGEFSLSDFVVGSKKAVEVVSRKISDGDMKSLNGLVSSDILPNLQQAISLMSLTEREQFAINVDDIYFSFPYQVGVIFNEDNDQKRFVEVTMVFHALRGLAAMKSRGEEPPLNMGMQPEYQNRISICNYRFIKEFTKGVESDWTINLLNHFKPIDDLPQQSQ